MAGKELFMWTVEGQLSRDRIDTIVETLGKMGLRVTRHEVEQPGILDIRSELPPTLFDKRQFMSAFSSILGKDSKYAGRAWSFLKGTFLYDMRAQDPLTDLDFEKDRSWQEPFTRRANYLPSGLRFCQSGGEGTPFDLLDVGSVVEFVARTDMAIVERGKESGMRGVMCGAAPQYLEDLRRFSAEQLPG